MRAEDLRPEELIRPDPVNGLPFFGSARLVVTGAGPFLSRLGLDLMERLGEPALQAIFFRFGYESGLGMATSLSEVYQWESDLEWFKAGSVVRRWSGLAVEEITELDFDRAAGRCRFQGLWRESFQVRLRPPDQRPPYQQPICSILAGAASGYASACLGREVLVRETECAFNGAPACRFEGRPVEEWGLTPEQLRRQYSLPEVNDEMDRLRQALTTTRQQLQAQQDELERLRARAVSPSETGFVHRGEAMERVLQLCLKAAPTPSSLLLVGETGTGKEVLARFIHRHSGRADQPYLAVNCAALPPNLLESELFGHVKGAFTGAHRHRRGRLEEADGGLLFMDEIGELSLTGQVKLLRVLESKSFERVGDQRPVQADVRFVAATNRDLRAMVAAGEFRHDLFFRLNVIPIFMPPLRQRPEDVPALVDHFLARLVKSTGKAITGASSQVMTRLMNHAWPGNVRELRTTLEYAFVVADQGRIEPRHLPPGLAPAADSAADAPKGRPDPAPPAQARPEGKPRDAELRQELLEALELCGGNLSQAARRLGVSRATVWNRMHRFGLVVRRVTADARDDVQ